MGSFVPVRSYHKGTFRAVLFQCEVVPHRKVVDVSSNVYKNASMCMCRLCDGNNAFNKQAYDIITHGHSLVPN